MGRPRTFDDHEALDAAVRCFWHRGYEATSVRELSAEMGICGTSLYNAFGGKRALFVKALEHYLDANTRARIQRFETSFSPKEAVFGFIEDIIDRSLSDSERRGCFLINSALEVAPHDAELGAVIAERLGEIEDFFHRCIAAAQAAGEIPKTRDARDLSRLLLGVVVSVRVLARVKPDRELMQGIVRPALALLAWRSSGLLLTNEKEKI